MDLGLVLISQTRRRPTRIAKRSPVLPTNRARQPIPFVGLKYRKHGDRVDRPVGARVPEAATHLPELEGQGQEQEGWQGPEMVQGRWSGLPYAQDCY